MIEHTSNLVFNVSLSNRIKKLLPDTNGEYRVLLKFNEGNNDT
jgi:hypothetical protein